MVDQPRRYWCTYWRHCGNAGSGVIGARTSGNAGMPGPQESGQPLAGDRPKERQAPTQGLAGVIFLNNVGFQESILDFGGYLSEVVFGSCVLVGCMSVLGVVFLSFYLASLRFSLRPYQVVSVVTPD